MPTIAMVRMSSVAFAQFEMGTTGQLQSVVASVKLPKNGHMHLLASYLVMMLVAVGDGNLASESY